MNEKLMKRLVQKLIDLGYGKVENYKIVLYRDKIDIKIKEMETLDINKKLCIYVNDREYLTSILATLSVSKDNNEFKKLLNNPKEIKNRGILPEISLRYIVLNLFYDMENPERIKDYYRFKPFKDLYGHIDKYEKILLN